MMDSSELTALARSRFRFLNQSEIKLLSAVTNGNPAYCGPSGLDSDPENDPSGSDSWGSEREVRADLIRWLIVDETAKTCVDSRGFILHGAKITGPLDLSYVKASFPLRLRHCRIVEHLHLNVMEISTLDLTGTHVASLSADLAKVSGSLHLVQGFESVGPVSLRGAQIGGNLNCDGGTFHSNSSEPDPGVALNAESAKINGFVMLRDGFSADGTVRLFRAYIGANLNCADAQFRSSVLSSHPLALNAECAVISGAVLLGPNFSAEGEVRLWAADIGGSVVCEKAKLKNVLNEAIPGSGVALQADGIRVTGNVFLNHISAEGQVRLVGARIQGSLTSEQATFKVAPKDDLSGVALIVEAAEVLGYVNLRNNFLAEGGVRLFRSSIGLGLDCSDAKFKNANIALDCYAADIKGPVSLRNGFESNGAVRFASANIQGTIYCSNATLKNPSKWALDASDMKIRGSVLLMPKVSVEGAIRLFAAEIGRNLEADGSKFSFPLSDENRDKRLAIDAEAATITGTVLLRNDFSADGAIRFFGAHIGGHLACSKGTFRNTLPDETAGISLDGTSLVVDGNVFLDHSIHDFVTLANARIANLLNYQKAKFSGLQLTDAAAGIIVDDHESWPANTLYLDGFVYKRIAGGPTDVPNRLEWLGRQKSFARQPYLQLATVLDAAGDNGGARRIRSEMERQVWQRRHRLLRPISDLLRVTIGYGHFPLRAIWLLLALVVIGAAVYEAGYRLGAIVPTEPNAHVYFQNNCSPPNHYQTFQSLPYSLENSFPVIKLGTQDKWIPAPQQSVANCVQQGRLIRLSSIITPAVLSSMRWFQICAGWILSTLFVAGVTGVLRKN